MRTTTGNKYNIAIRRGDTFRLLVTASVRSASGTTTVIDITGYSFSGMVRALDGTVLATFTMSIIDAAAGEFQILLSAATTAAIDTQTHTVAKYDIQWTTVAGDVRTIMKGNVMFETDVTYA